jgi:integrase
MTFQTVAEAWFDRRRHALRPGTVRNYRVVLDAHLLPRFGYMKVAAIRPSEVESFRAEMAARGKGANTIRNVLGVLRQILRELVVDEQLGSNPMDGLARGKRPGRPPRRIEVPTPAEVEALIAAARPEARPVFELAASVGLRRAELLALTWEDVDFAASAITVRESKTAAGERRVPMFGSARKVLLEQKARSRFSRPGDYVFPTAVGIPENPAAWSSREFYYARRRAKLRETLRFHDLRHYAVSRLIEQGANILLVSRIAGHAKASVTLDVYAHLFAEGIEEAAARFDPLAAGRRAVDGATVAGR